MIGGAVSANASAANGGYHSLIYGFNECVFYGSDNADPYFWWYENEKSYATTGQWIVDDGNHSTGHYYNIIDEDNAAIGYGISGFKYKYVNTENGEVTYADSDYRDADNLEIKNAIYYDAEGKKHLGTMAGIDAMTSEERVSSGYYTIDEFEDLLDAYVESIEAAYRAAGKNICHISSCTTAESSFLYTGSEIRPAVTVKNDKGVLLTEGTDYTLSYSNNINVGQAVITVTGIGSYAGDIKTKEFSIVSSGGGDTPETEAGTGTTSRLAGSSRIDTALLIAGELRKLNGNQKFNCAVIATGSNFPDALAGSAFASTQNAPVLLVDKSFSAAGTQTTLQALPIYLNDGAVVYLLGGSSAIDTDTENALRNSGYTVVRLCGDDRYLTDQAIINAMNVSEGTDLVVVRGDSFADSLSISGVAGSRGMPILLADRSGLKDYQLDIIRRIKPAHIYIIGGTAAVTGAVEGVLNTMCSNVIRLSGETRYETGIAVAKAFNMESASAAVIATGDNFPDGLAGGTLAARLNAPVILVSPNAAGNGNDVVRSFLKTSYAGSLYILGGTAAVPDAVLSSLNISVRSISYTGTAITLS